MNQLPLPPETLKEHVIKPFNHDGKYRGMACSCGFTASTGIQYDDEAYCAQHLLEVSTPNQNGGENMIGDDISRINSKPPLETSNPSEGRTDDTLARQIAEALCKHFSVHGRGSRGFVDYRVEPLTVIQFIQPLIAPLVEEVKHQTLMADALELAERSSKAKWLEAESQRDALREALRGCVEALNQARVWTNKHGIELICSEAITTATALLAQQEEGK